ncbi:hypothetical protein HUU42_05170 [bacterium]|nr:hypothetical protein [bacterium]
MSNLREGRVLRSLIVWTLAGFLLLTPLASQFAMAQDNKGDVSAACSLAEQRAEMDINGGTWFIIGCLGGIIGWLIAEAVDSNPPATELVGKSEEFVAKYSDCYKAKAKSIKTSKAITGCLVGTGISVILYAIAFSTAENTND